MSYALFGNKCSILRSKFIYWDSMTVLSFSNWLHLWCESVVSATHALHNCPILLLHWFGSWDWIWWLHHINFEFEIGRSFVRTDLSCTFETHPSSFWNIRLLHCFQSEITIMVDNLLSFWRICMVLTSLSCDLCIPCSFFWGTSSFFIFNQC